MNKKIKLWNLYLKYWAYNNNDNNKGIDEASKTICHHLSLQVYARPRVFWCSRLWVDLKPFLPLVFSFCF